MSEKTLRDDGTERDAGLAALYRAAAREEPPSALDDAIRAAARRSVSSRPQRVSSPFIRSWRVPLSVAAVMLLTVSLVTVMREEAPEVMLPPGGARPFGETDHMRAGPAADAGERATAVPKAVAPPAQRSDNVGLKPPAQPGASGIGLRDNSVSPPASRSRQDMAAASRMETDASTAPALAKRATPEAFPGAAGTRDDKMVAPAEVLRQSAKEEVPPVPARMAEATTRKSAATPAKGPAPAAGAAAEGKVQSKPEPASADAAMGEPSQARVDAAAVARPSASPPASQMAAGVIKSRADLAPDKWLERIDELRRQGRLDEAKASLAEFRKRYPDYELPASLKGWARP